MIIVISSLSLSFCVCACPVFLYIYRLYTHLVVLALPLVFFFLLHLFFFLLDQKKGPLSPPHSIIFISCLDMDIIFISCGKGFSLSLNLSLSLFLFFFTLPCSCLHFLPQEHATFCVFCFCFCFFLVCGDSSVVGVSLFSWLFFPSLLCVRVLVSCFCFCFCFPFCSFYFSFVLCVPISYHRVLLGFVIFSFFFRLPPFFGALLCWLWFFFSQKNVQFVFFCLSFFCLS